MDGAPVFVICPARSGSTLLARMLSCHSSIYCRPEPHLIAPLHQLGFYGIAEKPGRHQERLAFIPFVTREAIHNIVAELPRGEEDYLDALRAYLDTIYGRLLRASGKKIFVDKTPRNAQFVDLVVKLYPHTRFIVLVRNPIAVAVSMLRLSIGVLQREGHAMPPGRAEEVALFHFLGSVSDVEAVLRAPPVPSIHLHFEELVAEPEGSLRRVCAFLEVGYEPAMLEYGANGRGWSGPGDPFVVNQHSRPDRSYAERWIEELEKDPAQLAFAHQALAATPPEHIVRWGYAPEQLRALLDRLSAERSGVVR